MTLKKSHLMIENVKSVFSTEQVNAILANTLSKHNSSAKPSKTESRYASMLRESRKLRLLYGDLSKKYLQKIFQKSKCSPSRSVENIFSILESRLDVVLYRAAFFESIAAAKQVIHLGGIKVNEKKVVSPGYIVVPGDVVRVIEKKRDLDLLQRNCHFSSFKSSGILLGSSLEIQKTATFPEERSKSVAPTRTTYDTHSTKQSFVSANTCLSSIGNLDGVTRGLYKKSFFTNPTLEYQRKIGWRFQASFVLLSLLKLREGTKLIAFISKALNKFKSKNEIKSRKIKEFAMNAISQSDNRSSQNNDATKKDEKKDNLDAIANFNKENKIYYLQNNTKHKSNYDLAVKNKTPFFFLSRNSFFTKLSFVEKELFSSEQLVPAGTTLDKKRITRVNLLCKSSITPSVVHGCAKQRNVESRLVKQLSFLNFYQNSIKPRRKLKRFLLFSEKVNDLSTKKTKETFEKSVILDNNFIFLNYLLHLRKQLLSLHKKNNCFEEQKKKSFFKKQLFLKSKKVKPLHLEISYRSLCIIFLFPPQRVTFPSFINLSLIYK